MATKSKKSKLYQTGCKVCGVCLLLISAMAVFFSGVVYSSVTKNWGDSVLIQESFYDTPEFREAFYLTLDEAILADVYYESEESILSGEKVNREELLSNFKRYYGIIDGIITGNTEVNDTYDGLIVYGTIPETMEENFLEYQQLVETRLPQYRQIYIQDQLDDYRTAVRYLEEMENFHYCVMDQSGAVVSGNATKTEIGSKSRTMLLSAEFCSDNLGEEEYYPYSNYYLENSNYQVYAAVDDPLTEGDVFYEMNREFLLAKASLPYLFAISAVSALIFLCCLIYLIRVAGQKKKGGPVRYLMVDHIYNEIHFLLVMLFGVFSFFVALMLLDVILSRGLLFWSYVFITLLGVLYVTDIVVALSYILSLSRQIKGGTLFRNTLVSVLLRKIASLFVGTTFRGWMLLILLAYGMGNCVLTFFLCMYWYSGYMAVFLCLLILFNVFCLYLCMRALRSLKRIMISARETSKGNFSYQLDLAEISPSFLNFAEDIANIQDGLKKAVEEAVKGERMKTELITNVSHDLKTPLTSIITYADLLKQEKLDNPVAREYVEVLHVKSYRLKQLIEDLIEASKVSSGNVAVVNMRVDYRQLMMQAIGEMEEKIEEVGLEFKISCPEPVYIDADGRHMWRILENLLSNAMKYSMPHSRVYVDIFSADTSGVLVMKNISAAPIDFDATRLTDRFVRGDSSRTTEGSGLGLSIAQSLTEIQGGTFGIQVDGDLFKVVVQMPLWVEEEQGVQEEMDLEEEQEEMEHPADDVTAAQQQESVPSTNT